MVVLSEKLEAMLPPPPSYYSSESNNPDTLPAPPPFPGHSAARTKATFSSLQPHILLHIIHQTLPQEDLPGAQSAYGQADGESKLERQRRVLYWLSMSLRLVSRSVYVACMHVLRSTYLPAYTSNIRFPYTSDPFPFSSSRGSPSGSLHADLPSPLNPNHRETAILDLFLALKVREDVWADETELYLGRGESFRDLFELMQPKARLEDLVGEMLAESGTGTWEGRHSTPSTPTTPSSSQAHHTEYAKSSTPPTPTHSHTKSKSPSSTLSSMGVVSSIRRAFTSSSSSKLTLSKQKEKEHDREIGHEASQSLSGSVSGSISPPSPLFNHTAISFSALSISFSPRRVGLLINLTTTSSRSFPSIYDILGVAGGSSVGGKRTIVEVPRERDERLEVSAAKIVQELKMLRLTN